LKIGTINFLDKIYITGEHHIHNLKNSYHCLWDKVMSKAKTQGNFCDEVATQIKKHLQLSEETFNYLCLTNEIYNEVFLIIKL